MGSPNRFDFSNPGLYNKVYIPLLHDENALKIIYGGRDSGKSDFIAQNYIIDSFQYSFFRGLLVRKFLEHIKLAQIQTLKDYIRLWELGNYFHTVEHPFRLTNTVTDNFIIAKGLDKSENTKSIKDITSAWYEEADELSEIDYDTTTLSLRTSKDVPIKEYMSFNPRKETSWINKRFFPEVKNIYESEDGNFHYVQSTKPGVTILHTNYRDNRYCSPKRIEKLESYKNIDENFYKVNTLGLWGGALKGLIYKRWTPIDSIPEGGDEVFGLDYGVNDPTALVQVKFKEQRLHCKQLIYQSDLTHPDVVDLIDSKYKSLIGRNLLIVENAELSLIKLLQRANYNAIGCIKGPNSVYDGIMLMQQLELAITKDSPDLIDEINAYCWKTDRAGRIFDTPVDLNNHALDAIRYIIQTYGINYWFSRSNISLPKVISKAHSNRFSVGSQMAGFR
jgi:phage terminase large subunit